TISNSISLDSYMSTFLLIIFIMGVMFELPLLLWLLNRIGIVDKAILRKYRRHAIVALMVLAAIITPTGDPFTLLIVFTPLYALYELGILMTRES
ncbi:MAG: twin-arginine translocase subunit TatC, partial [Bacteroidaceae bacterium]|nr:twin-arginine translocase subunit TatC [Bacteroidaceae bacterium]